MWAATFWMTLIGTILSITNNRAGYVTLVVVGYGGLGITYSQVSQRYRGGYSDLRAFWDMLRNPPPRKTLKLWTIEVLMHLPQAMAGTYLLTR